MVYLDYSLLILGGMVDFDDYKSSSPYPLVELEVEVRVLRRQVRHQGNFLQQIDEMGGRCLEQIDEDMGRIRSEFMAALRVLEEKVTVALENLDLRLQSMEGTLAKLQDAGKSGHGTSQLAIKPSSGEMAKHR